MKPYYWNDNITVYNDDCLEVMKQFEDNSFVMTLTSPPYDDLRTYGGITWNDVIWKEVIIELFRITKEGGVVVWVVGDGTINGSETGTSFKQALWAKECGFKLHDTMIYQKYARNPSSNRYSQDFEYMFIFSKNKPKTINFLKDQPKSKVSFHSHYKYKGRRRKDGTLFKDKTKIKQNLSLYRKRGNIWNYGNVANGTNHEHPASFPLNLARDHIISWSNKNDLVLDCFMGSGTTLVAAKELGRKAVGIDMNQKYCDISINWLKGTYRQLSLEEMSGSKKQLSLDET